MEIISQHTKQIMEECKSRARDAGLSFSDDTLEYIVTNQDMIELSPKGMIPTLYDYWINDLEVIKSKKEYELYPHNAYETVINSRPAISFYNDNNPDWLNVMIFYHVIAHIDFMQNNMFFKNTWNDDFVGQALADKRLISNFRTKYGRWVDYVIEFTRGIDNITGYFNTLSPLHTKDRKKIKKIDYYFDIFLQIEKQVKMPVYLKELENYNAILAKGKKNTDALFLTEIKSKYPEFESCYHKYIKKVHEKPSDIIQYLMQNSEFINKEENKWMKSVMEIVRNTTLYFDPQRRTKTLNEGWATYWHNYLFIRDNRIKGHEADFAKLNAFVAAIPVVGYNPYAIGYSLLEYIEEETNKGKLTFDFENILKRDIRKTYNKHTGKGQEQLFKIRKNHCDFTFINSFINQDFVDRYKLVTVGERINQVRMTKEYYIKSKNYKDYKKYIIKHFIHPPHITVDKEKTADGVLYLKHHYEHKQLIPEFIDNTMIGIEYLWGGEVKLETHLIVGGKPQKIIYTAKDRKITQNAG
jgi:stage V sporulation protein R